MNTTQKRMIIVESPSKIKTIKKYLDNQYTIGASVGHIRDLPSKEIGIDVDNNFHQSIGLDAHLIKTMFDAHESGLRDYKWPLFTLYSLAFWLDNERKKN